MKEKMYHEEKKLLLKEYYSENSNIQTNLYKKLKIKKKNHNQNYFIILKTENEWIIFSIDYKNN